MIRTFTLTAAALALAGCQLPGFSEATGDVNAEFALAQQLRDRCNTSGDVDDCLAWREFQEGRSMPAWQYDAALDRWIANGPY